MIAVAYAGRPSPHPSPRAQGEGVFPPDDSRIRTRHSPGFRMSHPRWKRGERRHGMLLGGTHRPDAASSSSNRLSAAADARHTAAALALEAAVGGSRGVRRGRVGLAAAAGVDADVARGTAVAAAAERRAAHVVRAAAGVGTAALRERLGTVASGLALPAAVAALRRTGPTGGAGTVETALLRAALPRPKLVAFVVRALAAILLPPLPLQPSEASSLPLPAPLVPVIRGLRFFARGASERHGRNAGQGGAYRFPPRSAGARQRLRQLIEPPSLHQHLSLSVRIRRSPPPHAQRECRGDVRLHSVAVSRGI